MTSNSVTIVLKYASLNALRQDSVATVVDHDVHEAGEGKEEVDGGIADVGDVLGLADLHSLLLGVILVPGQGDGQHGPDDPDPGQDEFHYALPG